MNWDKRENRRQEQGWRVRFPHRDHWPHAKRPVALRGRSTEGEKKWAIVAEEVSRGQTPGLPRATFGNVDDMLRAVDRVTGFNQGSRRIRFVFWRPFLSAGRIKDLKRERSIRTFTSCWWAYELVQSLWRAVWRYLVKSKTLISYDLIVPTLLENDSHLCKVQEDLYKMFILTLLEPNIVNKINIHQEENR